MSMMCARWVRRSTTAFARRGSGNTFVHAARADGVSADRADAQGSEGPRSWPREELRDRSGPDQRAARLRRRTARCRGTGRAISSSASGSPRQERPSARGARRRGCPQRDRRRIAVALPEQLRRSLPWDQDAEMAQHAELRIDTGLPVYFCDPHSTWQRGTNEKTRTAFCGGTSRKAPTCPGTPRMTSPQSPPHSPPDLARRAAGKHPAKPSTSICEHATHTLLRQPVESAQYVSFGFGQAARDAGIARSMAPKGDCWDCDDCQGRWGGLTLACD